MPNLPLRSALALTVSGLGVGWAAMAQATAAPHDTPCVHYSAGGQTGDVCAEAPDVPPEAPELPDAPAAWADEGVPDLGMALEEALLGAEKQASATGATADETLAQKGVPAGTATVMTAAAPLLEQVRTGLGAAVSQVEKTALVAVARAPGLIKQADKEAGQTFEDGLEKADFAADAVVGGADKVIDQSQVGAGNVRGHVHRAREAIGR